MYNSGFWYCTECAKKSQSDLKRCSVSDFWSKNIVKTRLKAQHVKRMLTCLFCFKNPRKMQTNKYTLRKIEYS